MLLSIGCCAERAMLHAWECGGDKHWVPDIVVIKRRTMMTAAFERWGRFALVVGFVVMGLAVSLFFVGARQYLDPPACFLSS